MSVRASIRSKNFAAVVAGLKRADAAIIPAAAQALNLGLVEAVGIVQTEFLQGPRPAKLGEVTGRLRQSIAHDVVVTEKGVVGRIGTNVVYGAFHEFGFKGEVNVRAHQRHVEDSNWTTGDGRKKVALLDRLGQTIGFKRESIKQAARRGVAFVVQNVRAHVRHLNYSGRPFVRPGLEQSLPRIKELIETAIQKAVKGGSAS